MSLGGFVGGNGGGGGNGVGDGRLGVGGPYTAMSTAAMGQSPLISPPIAQPVFNFPALSLALKPKMDGHSEMALMGENFDPILMGRIKEDGHKSRSESDELEAASGDDQDATGDKHPRRKKYHRHTPSQIQELEA
ncbi:hypothetical protein U1Q18_004477 [Sarracenia purpurea var. burkii]